MPEDTRPRQTLAMRMAEQSRLRAERLARLVPVGAGRSEADGPATDTPPGTTSGDHDASAALEEFLRSLTQGLNGLPPRAAPPAAAQPAEVLRFQRSPAATEAPPCDLERLEGVGPGLVWALRRAGVPDLAGLAALDAEDLTDRLGPIGRLVPARAWIAAARGETGRKVPSGLVHEDDFGLGG